MKLDGKRKDLHVRRIVRIRLEKNPRACMLIPLSRVLKEVPGTGE
jgi:hypothetical protein